MPYRYPSSTRSYDSDDQLSVQGDQQHDDTHFQVQTDYLPQQDVDMSHDRGFHIYGSRGSYGGSEPAHQYDQQDTTHHQQHTTYDYSHPEEHYRHSDGSERENSPLMVDVRHVTDHINRMTADCTAQARLFEQRAAAAEEARQRAHVRLDRVHAEVEHLQNQVDDLQVAISTLYGELKHTQSELVKEKSRTSSLSNIVARLEEEAEMWRNLYDKVCHEFRNSADAYVRGDNAPGTRALHAMRRASRSALGSLTGRFV